ncbi:MAG: hypothetical protein Q7J24_01685 [Desulfomicrobium sp.]|nr:hypothetical protein [Desulfomicrobium sp.]
MEQCIAPPLPPSIETITTLEYLGISLPDAFIVAFLLILVALFLSAFIGGRRIGPIDIPRLCPDPGMKCRVTTVVASLILIGLFGWVALWEGYTWVGFASDARAEQRLAYEAARTSYNTCTRSICVADSSSGILKPPIVIHSRGNASVGNTRFVQSDRSSNCEVNFLVEWQADQGHFLFLPEGAEPLTRSYNGGASETVVTQPALSNAGPQALQSITLSGSVSKSRKALRRRDCGVVATLNAVQLPNICRSSLGVN